MNREQQAAMAAATRLTREGRLAEATALIQRTLAGLPGTGVPTTASPAAAQAPHARPRRRAGGEGAAAVAGTLQPGAGLHRPARVPGPARQHNPLLPRLPGLLRRLPGAFPDSAGRPDAAARPGGRFVQRSYTDAAGTRTYKLYIPTGYRGQDVPLIVMLHGGTQTADGFAAGTRMNELAERDTFLVAYPEQDRAANPGGYWNWFEPAHQITGAGEPSLIAGITKQVMTAYSVDNSRVYVAGLSAGGAMAAVMAATYPDLYAAAAVHSGLPFGAARDLPSAFAAMHQGPPPGTGRAAAGVPLIVFHGDQDPVVAAVNADHLVGHALRAATKRARSGPGQHTAATTSARVNGHPCTRTVYQDATGHTVVEHWTIHQAGHAWSGGSPHGSHTDPQGPDASAEFVRFFATHRKPQTASRSR